MNLVEGEYIHQIEELDDGQCIPPSGTKEIGLTTQIGWWQGVAASDPNRAGLFPGISYPGSHASYMLT